MYAVACPKTPLFAEHYNPNVMLVILTSTPDGSDTLEERVSMGAYFEFIFFAEGDNRYWEMMEAFDKLGYYETTTPNGLDGVNGFYPTTIFPETDNYKNS